MNEDTPAINELRKQLAEQDKIRRQQPVVQTTRIVKALDKLNANLSSLTTAIYEVNDYEYVDDFDGWLPAIRRPLPKELKEQNESA